jgi:hypothetical protein
MKAGKYSPPYGAFFNSPYLGIAVSEDKYVAIHGLYHGIKFAHLINVENEVLLCTHNPILIKNFYGMLRDEGFHVIIADHPALAVRMIFHGKYIVAIIDSESFGLSAEETVQIIRSISPDMPIIVAGNNTYTGGVLSVKTPVDLEEFKDVIHALMSSAKL